MIFVVRSDCKVKPRQLIEMSGSAVILLYKLNIHKKNRVLLRNWELISAPKVFYQCSEVGLIEKSIETCKILKVAYVVLKFNDGSPSLLAIGPVTPKREKKIIQEMQILD